MIRDKLYDAYIFGSMAVGCALAAPFVAYYLVKEELKLRRK